MRIYHMDFNAIILFLQAVALTVHDPSFNPFLLFLLVLHNLLKRLPVSR